MTNEKKAPTRLWRADWDQQTTEDVRKAVYRAVADANGKNWLKTIDPEKVMTVLLSGRHPTLIIGGYLVMYTINEPWFAPQGTKAFTEQVFLRVFEGEGNARSLMRAIETLAREQGCTSISISTALNNSDEKLTRFCGLFGYKSEARLLYKEVG